MDRRGFLRLLGGAVAAAAAPTKTYAFFGGILRPRPALTISDVAKAHPLGLAHLVGELQMSRDGIVWEPYRGAMKLKVEPFVKMIKDSAPRLVDQLMVVTKDDMVDFGSALPEARYVRVQHRSIFSQPNDPKSFAPQFVIRTEEQG